VTALALDKLDIASALAHLSLLEESDASLPAPSDIPKIGVVREELQLAYLTVHDHRILSLVEHQSPRVEVINLHLSSFKCHSNMLEARIDLTCSKLLLNMLII
jgi:hypothetical protein